MKLKNKIVSLLFLAVGASGCTDDFEKINSDPNKLYEVSMQTIFPGTVYRTMNVLSDLNMNRLMSYSRYVTIGYAQKPWSDRGDSYYRQFYVDIMRDLNDLDIKYENDPTSRNYKGIIKTWKAFIYYQIATLYGPFGMSDFGMGNDMEKLSFRYDSEADMYTQILAMLDIAVDSFDPYLTNVMAYDPVYRDTSGKSIIERWRKLANTLRLEIALNVQNIDLEQARAYVGKSMEHEDWFFESQADAFVLKYGTVDGTDGSRYYASWYKDQILKDNWGNIPSMNEYFATYLFSYNDPRMQEFFDESNFNDRTAVPYLMPDIITRVHNCEDEDNPCTAEQMAEHLQYLIEGKVLHDSVRVRYTIPYVPTKDSNYMPFSWERKLDPTDPTGLRHVEDPLQMQNEKTNRCYIKSKYYAIDCDLPLLRLTDSYFLRAEASILFNQGAKTAQEYYESGIAASFEEFGVGSKLSDYMAQNGVKWNTDGVGLRDTRALFRADINGKGDAVNHLEQVYKQRYFAGFLNGISAWRLERRTRALNFPPAFLNGAESIEEGGDPWYAYAERLYYPDHERFNNGTAYYEGILLLQKNSPAPNEAFHGNNVFTLLQFAKPIPDVETRIKGYRELQYPDLNMDMQAKKYGKTYEEMLEVAKKKTGITNDDKRAMQQAFSYTVTQLISTYIVE